MEQSLEKEETTKSKIYAILHPNIKTSTSFPQSSEDMYEKIKEKVLKYQKLKLKFVECRKELDMVCRTLMPKYLKELTYEELNEKWSEFVETKDSINESTALIFNSNNRSYRDCLKELSKYKMPSIEMYWFNYVPKKLDELTDFLDHSTSPKQKVFIFNASSYSILECKNYICSLKGLAFKCTEKFALHNVKISGDELCSLIRFGRNVKILEFRSCVIEAYLECNFGDINECRIKQLDFRWSGDSGLSDWRGNEKVLFNILKGVEKCHNLKSNLDLIDLTSEYLADIKEEIKTKIKNKFPLLKNITIII